MATQDMASKSSSAFDAVAPNIIKPYTTESGGLGQRLRQAAIVVSVMLFCTVYGAAFAFLAPALVILFLVPIALLALIVIWALPSALRAPTGTLEVLFFSFFIVLIIWPNYIALALPGLPWITAARITGLPLFLTLLICLSTSSNFGSKLSQAFRATPLLTILLFTFVIIQAVSIALSDQKGESIDKFFTAQTTWTAMAVIATYVFQKPGRVRLWVYILWGMAILTGLIGVLEYHQKKVLWAGHIPRFLAIQDPAVLGQLAGITRAFSNIYRTQSTFGTSIDFAEYLSFTFPFLLHFVAKPFPLLIRGAAAASIPFLALVVYFTGSRSGPVGFLLASLVYLLYWGVQQWRTKRSGLIGPLVVISYPAIGVVAMAAVLLIGRLRKLVLGGGAAKSSTNSRIEQFQLGLPKIIKNPFGYGIGRGGETVGWLTPDGFLSIDSYYLLVAVEYGVLGFCVFFGMIIWAVISALRVSFFENLMDDELSFLTPAALALLNFFVIRGVFSQQNNVPIVYMLLGMIIALLFRRKTEVEMAKAQMLGACSVDREGLL